MKLLLAISLLLSGSIFAKDYANVSIDNTLAEVDCQLVVLKDINYPRNVNEMHLGGLVNKKNRYKSYAGVSLRSRLSSSKPRILKAGTKLKIGGTLDNTLHLNDYRFDYLIFDQTIGMPYNPGAAKVSSIYYSSGGHLKVFCPEITPVEF